MIRACKLRTPAFECQRLPRPPLPPPPLPVPLPPPPLPPPQLPPPTLLPSPPPPPVLHLLFQASWWLNWCGGGWVRGPSGLFWALSWLVISQVTHLSF